MMIRKLTAVVLVVGLTACAALAQGKAKGAKAEANESAGKDVSRAMIFDAAQIDSYRTPSLITVLDVGDQDSDPIKLDRSFKEALKENVDKESIARLSQ